MRYLICAASLLAIFVHLRAIEAIERSQDRAHPAGLILKKFSNSRTAIYGVPFSQGQDPEQSVRNYLGVDRDLRLISQRRLKDGLQVALTYDFYYQGLKVEGAFVKALVRNHAPFQVLFIESQLPQSFRSFRNLNLLAKPQGAELLYKLDESSGEAALVYKILEIDDKPIPPIRQAHYYEAVSGKLLATENLVAFEVLQGRTDGFVTPNLLPASLSNPGTLVSLPKTQIEIVEPQGYPVSTSSPSAQYSLDINAQNASLRASLVNSFVRVINASSQGSLSQSRDSNLPGVLNFLLPQNRGDEDQVAQANIFYVVTALHDWIRGFSPDFSELDIQVLGQANINAACNAYYVQNSINFYRASLGCANTAYSTIIAHEYGHFVVSRLGLQQGAFGEGYSDSLAMLYFNTAFIGQGFSLSNPQALRSPFSDRVPYPCRGESHECGQTLAGTFWQLRELYRTNFGQTGITMANQLFMDWSQITGGGMGLDSAHPLTAIEILAIDDDDGILENGSPHYSEICAAFQTRNIECPPRHFYHVQMTPSNIGLLPVNQEQTIALSITPHYATQMPRAIRLRYKTDHGNWAMSTMTRFDESHYRAQLPRLNCGEGLEFYFEIEADFVNRQFFPPAPSHFEGFAGTQIRAVSNFDFSPEEQPDWTVENENLIEGDWRIGFVQPNNFPFQDMDGSGACLMTGSDGSGHIGGVTHISSPQIRVSADFVIVDYFRFVNSAWFPEDNAFSSFYRSNEEPWQPMETNVNSSLGFTQTSFKILTSGTSQLQLKFSHENGYDGDPGYAAVDHLQIRSYSCGPITSNPSETFSRVKTSIPSEICPADFNNDGLVNTSDLGDFMNAYESGESIADINLDGGVTGEDFEFFMRHFLNGC